MNATERENLITQLSQLKTNLDYDFFKRESTKREPVFQLVFEYSQEISERDSWRLLWILDHASALHPEYLLPILDRLYLIAVRTKNESVIRHVMKLILRQPIVEEFSGELLDRSVSWMLNKKAKISSQVLGLEFYYQMCILYPELSPELLHYIEQILLEAPSVGYKKRLERIKKELLK